MWPVPPVAHHYSRDGVSSKEDGVCLDWQGEVKAWAEVSTGGFSASNLLVKVWVFSISLALWSLTERALFFSLLALT